MVESLIPMGEQRKQHFLHTTAYGGCLICLGWQSRGHCEIFPDIILDTLANTATPQNDRKAQLHTYPILVQSRSTNGWMNTLPVIIANDPKRDDTHLV